MNHLRKKSILLTKRSELKLLAKPAIIEIIECIQVDGPATVKSIGRRIGRPPKSIYYHLRKLVQAGLLKPVALQLSGRRSEKIYDVSADRYSTNDASMSPQMRVDIQKALASVLRITHRDYSRSLGQSVAVTKGKGRTLMGIRRKVWLDQKSLAEVNGLINQIDDLLRKNSTMGKGKRIALTMVMTPLELKE